MGYKKGERVKIAQGFDEYNRRYFPTLLTHDLEVGEIVQGEFRAQPQNVTAVYVQFKYDPPRPDTSIGWPSTESNVIVPVCFLVRIVENEGKA